MHSTIAFSLELPFMWLFTHWLINNEMDPTKRDMWQIQYRPEHFSKVSKASRPINFQGSQQDSWMIGYISQSIEFLISTGYCNIEMTKIALELGKIQLSG